MLRCAAGVRLSLRIPRAANSLSLASDHCFYIDPSSCSGLKSGPWAKDREGEANMWLQLALACALFFGESKLGGRREPTSKGCRRGGSSALGSQAPPVRRMPRGMNGFFQGKLGETATTCHVLPASHSN